MSYRYQPMYKPQRDNPNELLSKHYLQKHTCNRVDELNEDPRFQLDIDYFLWNMNMGPEPIEREDEIMNILSHLCESD